MNKMGIPSNGIIQNAHLLLSMQKLNEIVDAINKMEKDLKVVLEASIILMHNEIEAEKAFNNLMGNNNIYVAEPQI